MLLGRTPAKGRVDSDLAFLASKFAAASKITGAVREEDADVELNYINCEGVVKSRAKAEVLMLVSSKIGRTEPWLWMKPTSKWLLQSGVVGYDLALCREINPSGYPMSVLYAGAGSDVSNVLLATDANKVLMVNLPTTYHQLPEAVSQWDSIPAGDPMKFNLGYTISVANTTSDYARKLVGELKAIGVDRKDVISIKKSDDALKDGSRIVFKWRHPAHSKKTLRTFTFIHEDIRKFSGWRKRAEDILPEGISIYFERAANEIPQDYDKFLSTVGASVNCAGMMVLDSSEGYVYAPGHELAGGLFAKPYKTDWMAWWEQFVPRISSYGWKLEIRRKEV